MSPDPQSPASPPAGRPQSLTDLFLSMTILALQGFGGVLAVVQRELVEKKRWMTREEFVEEWAVAQILPGPNVVNLALMIGDRYFGLRGGLVAVAGIFLAPLILVLLAGIFYVHYADHPALAGALRGMGAVAAGLIAAVGLKLLGALKLHPLGMALCIVLAVLCFIAVALLRWPLVWVLLGLGGVACVLTWRKIQ